MEYDAILELLMDAKSKYLKHYNSIKMKELMDGAKYAKKEMEAIQAMADTTEITEEMSKKYIFLKSTYDFYMRVKRNYEFSRFLKIQQRFFGKHSGMSVPNKKESEHFVFFNAILEEYTSNFPELDFNVRYIPLDHFVHFITLADCGIVMDGDEIHELKANRYYFMKKNVVKHLLNSNFIRIL
ncbi:hypothetical protein VCUG_01112 [Vavraia culicis subsp. floridensis]|uniref:DNA replication complex GINS protein SLD5 n=1 Tax=Vavraia culicis (isolate floridensis) TaxID=948595 RepID=L2GVN0_VAVCU|nr:uncharacterized protein VCUG_01112 [Vavraia culicis subsp. floridensis]ELA47343.1 hypothetical protein VCUG_01112 [Vavraia culicis subsp. floridensis]